MAAIKHPEHDPENARRFNWWWRGLFVLEEGPMAIGLLFDPGLIAPSVRWSKNADIGQTFRSLYAGCERSARFYELEKRVEGRYLFDVPWIELDDARRKSLLNIWPGRLRKGIFSSSVTESVGEEGWTVPQWLSWNLDLNNNTLVKSFEGFIAQERRRLNIPNPPANQGVQRRASSWLAIELIDLRDHGLLQLNDSQRSQVSSARRALTESLQRLL